MSLLIAAKSSLMTRKMPKHADRKAVLKATFLKVFRGLGKLKGYQLKFHSDQDVHPVAQPVGRITFSRRA